jgi:hypothetical protein
VGLSTGTDCPSPASVTATIEAAAGPFITDNANESPRERTGWLKEKEQLVASCARPL